MTYDELIERKNGLVKNQQACGSDLFWWGWEGEIEKNDIAIEKLIKEQCDVLIKRWGLKKLERYIKAIKELEEANKKLEEAKSKL